MSVLKRSLGLGKGKGRPSFPFLGTFSSGNCSRASERNGPNAANARTMPRVSACAPDERPRIGCSSRSTALPDCKGFDEKVLSSHPHAQSAGVLQRCGSDSHSTLLRTAHTSRLPTTAPAKEASERHAGDWPNIASLKPTRARRCGCDNQALLRALL